MPRTRLIGLALLLLSAITLAIAVPAFASRAAAFNKAQNFPHYRTTPLTSRHPTIHGRPVSITDEPASSPDAAKASVPPGLSLLRLTYGEGDSAKSQLVAIKSPPAPNIPDLLIYGDWLALVRVAEVTPTGERIHKDVGATGDAPDRFILVTRNTPEGFRPETWGSVRRTEWTFDFYEFLPDGSIAHRAARWPLNDPMFNVPAAEAELKGDPAQVEQARQAARQKKIDQLPESIRSLPELEERSVDYQVALYAIPRTQLPDLKFKHTAFNFQVMGWTFPAAAAAVLGFLAGAGLFFAPRRASAPAT